MKNIIKYQYAENLSGKLVHINEVNRNDSIEEKYVCIDCKNELIPRLGNIRTHHFSHKNDFNNCSKETYLHKLGKKIFYETYLQCIDDEIPFFITTSLFNSISYVCKYNGIIKSNECTVNRVNKYDLTQTFKIIELEKNNENYRPDLTLKNNEGEIIFIEIAVTHPCDKEKIESKNKIIELNIKNESDINLILEKNISEENNKIRFYNFDNFNIIVEPNCKDNALYNYLIVLKDGRQYPVKTTKKELCKNIFENINIVSNIIALKPINLRRNYQQRGPLINEIDSKIGSTKYKKYYRTKRRKR